MNALVEIAMCTRLCESTWYGDVGRPRQLELLERGIGSARGSTRVRTLAVDGADVATTCRSAVVCGSTDNAACSFGACWLKLRFSLNDLRRTGRFESGGMPH